MSAIVADAVTHPPLSHSDRISGRRLHAVIDLTVDTGQTPADSAYRSEERP